MLIINASSTPRPWPINKSMMSDLTQEKLEKRRAYQREYNKSEQGKARHKRFRQSEKGQQSRRKMYDNQRCFLLAVKAQLGCTYCGEDNPDSLVFRYPEPGIKKMWLNSVNGNYSMEKILEELEKSFVICYNCKQKKIWKLQPEPEAVQIPEKARRPWPLFGLLNKLPRIFRRSNPGMSGQVRIGSLSLFDIQELADRFGVHPVTITGLIRDGTLKAKRMGRKYFISEKSLEDYFHGS